MYKKEYQGGSHVEVFTAQGRDPLSRWKLTGSVNREYHKDVRGYVVTMEGGSSTINTQMKLPKTDKLLLGLVQPYLVLQLVVPDSTRLAIELSVVDKSGSRRRIQLSSSVKEIAATPLNARVPLTGILTGHWINLCVDVGSFVSGLFKGQVFKSLEGISIGGSCMLRRVFTLKSPPPDTIVEQAYTTDASALEEIPRACQMPSGVAAAETQVLRYGSVISPSHVQHLKDQSATNTIQASSSSATTTTTDERPTHIAFGKKVTIPDHILNTRQSSRQSAVDNIWTERGEEISLIDGQGLQPRPPSKPADPRVMRIQKKRVRVISGGKQKAMQATRSSTAPQTVESSATSVNDSVQDTDSVDSGFRTNTVTSDHSIHNVVEDTKIISDSYPPTIQPDNTGVQVKSLDLAAEDDNELSKWNGLAHDEQLALDVLKYKVKMNKTVNTLLTNPDESTDYVTSLNGRLDTSGTSEEHMDSTRESEGLDVSAVSSIQHSELDSSLDEVLYSYRSLPKSAERRQANVTDSLIMDVTGRNAGLEEDFISPRTSNDKGSPHGGDEEAAEVGERVRLNETRLSDDYDWRQYASGDGTDLTQSEMSLRTRLANAAPSQETPRALSTGPPRASSEMERTLSGSVTLSGWTEKFKNAARYPLHDSLDTRDMGGMLSPMMGTLTDQPDFPVDAVEPSNEGEEVELMYDPQLNCFYDPVTFKYYELAQ